MVRLTDCFDMTIVVNWAVKPHIKQNKGIDLATGTYYIYSSIC